jgi:hypothetical protein
VTEKKIILLNFSTSAACPENVYVHGNYNPILKNLLPVTAANSLPPLLRKKLNTLLWTLIYKFHLETSMEQQMEFNFESSIRG